MRRLSFLVGLAASAPFAGAAAQSSPPSLPQGLPGLPPVPSAMTERPTHKVEPPRGLPANAPRAKSPMSLVVLLENAPDPAESGVRKVVFREEATTTEYFNRYEGGSLRAAMRVRCATGEFQLEAFRLYSRNNLSGDVLASVERRSDWQATPADIGVKQALDLACGRPAPQLRATAAPPPTLRGAMSATPPVGAFAVQVGAAPTADGARQALADARRKQSALLAGRQTTVAVGPSGDRTVYRALVVGFADRPTAARLCAQLSARGQACFVRDRRADP